MRDYRRGDYKQCALWNSVAFYSGEIATFRRNILFSPSAYAYLFSDLLFGTNYGGDMHSETLEFLLRTGRYIQEVLALQFTDYLLA
jgi:hypothetical protein